MKDERLLERKVREAASSGGISCDEAFRLAGEMGVTPLDVGRAAGKLKIRIRGCRLGCF